uniref:BACK domain-containing protein n=1 Tax=Panagrolaimus sp. JU765 TaxID=591449 RepID=A0AC34QF51_9BILA
MLSHKWDGNKKEIELSEDEQCVEYFELFLKFIYLNRAQLNQTNVLPLLILADKYNFEGLRKVCVSYAISYILRELPLKELVNVWFSYSSKIGHSVLIQECVRIIAENFTELISDDWIKDWMALDRDQLIELLKSNDLVVPSEFVLFEALQKWISAPQSPERRGSTSSPSLIQILPFIRFPYMSAEELLRVETSSIAKVHSKLFLEYTHNAFRYISLPLNARINKDFHSTQFLLRSYSDVRWDKRITITNEQLYERGVDHSFPFSTRSSTVPVSNWNWTLKFTIASSFPNANDELKVNLSSDDMDNNPRSVEFHLMVVSDKKVLREVVGQKLFTKTRYHTDIELSKQVSINELFSENSNLLINGNLHLQLILRPIV